ncbi:hypothetical protein [Streptomyces sp. NPDC055607]
MARAAKQQTYATSGAVSVFLKWPHTQRVTRTVTYRNDGGTALALDLGVALDGTAGAGLLKSEAASVTMPARGTADVSPAVDPSAAAPGTCGGTLTARTTDRATVIRTAIGIVNEDERYDLTVRALDRSGAVTRSAEFAVLNTTTGESSRFRPVGDEIVARVPKGDYSVEGIVYGYEGGTLENTTRVSEPNTVVGSDTRRGNPVTVKTDSTTAVPTLRCTGVNQRVNGTLYEFRDHTDSDIDVYTVATPEVTSRPYSFVHLATLAEPSDSLTGDAYNLAFAEDGGIPAYPSFTAGKKSLAKVTSRYHTLGEPSLGSRSDLAAIDGSDRSTGGFYDISLPPKHTEYFTAGPRFTWSSGIDTGTTFDNSEPVVHRAGAHTTEPWNKAPLSPVVQATRCDDALTISSSATGRTGSAFEPEERTTLFRSDSVIFTSDRPRMNYTEGLPTEPGAYTLRPSATQQNPSVALGTRVEAEWDSSRHSAPRAGRSPLLNLRMDADLDLHDRAPVNRPLPITIGAGRADGRTAAVNRLSLKAPFDDGASWRNVPVTGGGS